MPERQILSFDEFYRKALAAKQKTGPGLEPGSFVVRTPITAAVQPAADEGARRISFVVATGDTNRNGWQLNPQGWEFANYEKNPVVLWAHDDSKLPVAKAEKVWVDGDLLKITALFTPAGWSSFNDAVFDCYDQGFLAAVSAGWIPLEYEFVEDEQGWRIMCSRQELIEVSFVPVPAEPNALRMAARAGIDIGPLRVWAAAILGDDRRYVLRVPDDFPPDRLAHAKKMLEDWHPGAKALIIPKSFELTSLDPLAAAFQVEESFIETAGVSPRNVSTELADKGEAWSAPTLGDFTSEAWGDLTDREKRRIAGHFAWSAEMPPAAYGSLKLPHHRPSDGKVVWRGCTAAMSRCMQPNTSIPEEDRRAVYNHLAAHYRAFEEEAPEFASVSAGTSAAETTDPIKCAPRPLTTPAAGTPAAAGNDASGERLIPGSPEWRIRQRGIHSI